MGDASSFAFLVGAPLWVAVLIYGIRTSKDWPAIMARWNETRRDKAAIADRQYIRMDARIKSLEGRCDHLEDELRECHRERDEAVAARLRAEALLNERRER